MKIIKETEEIMYQFDANKVKIAEPRVFAMFEADCFFCYNKS